MMLRIERMCLEDLAEVVEIENQSFAVPWSHSSFVHELLENRRAFYLVARNERQRIVGYLGMWEVFDEGHITNLASHPEFRRRGVAEALLKHLIKLAPQQGIQHLTLEVRRSNVAAQSLYQKLGFVHMGMRRKYYLDNNEDAFIMWKGSLF